MGSTGYVGLTAEQAKAEAMLGVTVLASSGNWYIYQTGDAETGTIELVYLLTSRYDNETVIKVIDIGAGPNATPPATIARTYLSYFGGDLHRAGGTYGAGILHRALNRPKQTRLTTGDIIELTGNTVDGDAIGNWSDGQPSAGIYTYLGGYRAVRYDRLRVRLRKDWRTQWEWTKQTPDP